MSRILGIDPGTACGWALLDNGVRVASGTWDLSFKRHESSGMRFLKLERQLQDALENCQPKLVAFETTAHLKGHANEVYWGIVGVIKLVCQRLGVESTGVQNSEVKRHATGKGNADKQAMRLAAVKRWGSPPDGPDFFFWDPSDDEADALWVASAVAERLVA